MSEYVPIVKIFGRALKRDAILCSAHGARFRIEDGFCSSGPCYGESLEAVAARIDADGQVFVPEDAGL